MLAAGLPELGDRLQLTICLPFLEGKEEELNRSADLLRIASDFLAMLVQN